MTDLDLNVRTKGIGGSEIASILGMNQYSSPYKVWLEKTGRQENNVQNKFTDAGNILENAVSDFFVFKTNHRVIKASAVQKTYVHPKYPFAIGTPDRRYIANSRVGKGVLECKTTQKMYDDIDMAWFCQLQWYLGILGLSYGSVAWLERGLDFKYKEYEYDKEFFEYLIDSASTFWNDNVLKDIPPEPLNVSDIEIMFRKHRDAVTIIASEELNDIHTKICVMRDTMKELKEQEEKLVDSVKMVMRDAEAVIYRETPLFTWKASKDTTTFDKERFKEEHPALWDQYQKTVEGSRRFLVK